MEELTPKEVATRIIQDRNRSNNRNYENAVMSKKMEAARKIEDLKNSSVASEGLL